MPHSVHFDYSDPFFYIHEGKIEVTEEQAENEPNLEAGDVKEFHNEYPRVPIRLRTKEWREIANDEFRLVFRVFVTELGEAIVEEGVPENYVAPDWWNNEEEETVMEWIKAIKNDSLPKEVIMDAITNAEIDKIELEAGDDETLATVDISVDDFPVEISFNSIEISFHPIRGTR